MANSFNVLLSNMHPKSSTPHADLSVCLDVCHLNMHDEPEKLWLRYTTGI